MQVYILLNEHEIDSHMQAAEARQGCAGSYLLKVVRAVARVLNIAHPSLPGLGLFRVARLDAEGAGGAHHQHLDGVRLWHAQTPHRETRASSPL